MVCCREDSEDQWVKLCRKWCFTTFGPTVLIWDIWKRVSTKTCRGTPTRHSWRTGGALHWNSQRQRWRWDAMAGQGVSRFAKESPVLGCWMFLAGARWEMSGLDHSPQDHSRSSSHDVSGARADDWRCWRSHRICQVWSRLSSTEDGDWDRRRDQRGCKNMQKLCGCVWTCPDMAATHDKARGKKCRTE